MVRCACLATRVRVPPLCMPLLTELVSRKGGLFDTQGAPNGAVPPDQICNRLTVFGRYWY